MRMVRIQRKGNSFSRQVSGWTGLAALILNVFIVRPQRQANFNAMEEARFEVLTQRARAEEIRAKKISNDVVIGDLKIEKLVMENELLKAKLRALGVGTDFKAENYPES